MKTEHPNGWIKIIMPNVEPIKLSVDFVFGEESQIALTRKLDRLSQESLGDWIEHTIITALKQLGYKSK